LFPCALNAGATFGQAGSTFVLAPTERKRYNDLQGKSNTGKNKVEQGKKEVRNNKMATNKAQTKNKMQYSILLEGIPFLNDYGTLARQCYQKQA